MSVATQTRKRLVIELDLEGAAFDDFGDQEVTMILHTAASKIEAGALNHAGVVLSPEYSLPLLDSNGNMAGTAEVVVR